MDHRRSGLGIAGRGTLGRLLRCVLGASLALTLAPGSAVASGACSDAPSYTQNGPYSWMGGPAVEQVVIFQAPSGTLTGEVFRPADTSTYQGPRPAILVMHGFGVDQCSVWWAARDFAGHGYSVLTFSESNFDRYTYEADAEAALGFLTGGSNPFHNYTDPLKVGVAGHSEGAIEAGLLQRDLPAGEVDAIVAFDNLHRYAVNDPGGAVACGGTPSDEITPRVPALGEAEDAPCKSNPLRRPADLKEGGWSAWQGAGQPSEIVVLAGTQHSDWAAAHARLADPGRLELFAYYAQAWFDRWLLGDTTAEQRLLATTVLGQPLSEVLSSRYHSGAFIGNVSTDDMRGTLH